MRPTRAAARVAGGLVLAIALAGCARGDIEIEGALDPSGPAEQRQATSAEENSGDGSNDLSAVQPEGTGDPFADMRGAAQHMPVIAATYTSGFADALDIPGAPESEAAQVRGDMTAFFQEHVYLLGTAVAAAQHAGPESPDFELAMDAVDANSVDLSDTVGALIGEGARESFLRNWRDQVDLFVEYAAAASEGDQAGMNQADEGLREYTDGVGQFFDRSTDGELDSDTVTEFFTGHVDTLIAAVDSLAAGEAEAYSSLKTAGDYAAAGSVLVSEGLSSTAGVPGDADDETSRLRATLTANLNEHVYLVGTAVFAAYTDEEGVGSDAFGAAAQVVDDNAVELADVVGELAGNEEEEAFLDLWREHIGYFVDYAQALAADDSAEAENALLKLDQYRSEAGEFFDTTTGGELAAEDVAEGLGMHVRTLTGAIDSLDEALAPES